jgi:hypothetical protein
MGDGVLRWPDRDWSQGDTKDLDFYMSRFDAADRLFRAAPTQKRREEKDLLERQFVEAYRSGLKGKGRSDDKGSAGYRGYLLSVVIDAPPLTPEQVSALKAILAPSLGQQTGETREVERERVSARAVAENRAREVAALHRGAGVYFVADDAGHVKIGHSDDTLKRLSQLQTGNSVPLHILHVSREPDVYRRVDLESMLHDRFAASRLRGEWFKLAGPIAKYVKQICAEECEPSE